MENKKSNGIISKNRTVADAKKVFELVIKSNGLSKYIMEDQTAKVSIQMMNNDKALLPSWLIRSEEISTVLFGKRLWNIKYQGDMSSLLGYSVHNEMENKPDVESNLPFSLIYLICEKALSDRVEFNPLERTYSPVTEYGYYFDIKNVNEHGDVMEFNSSRNIIAFEINKIMTNIARDNRLIRSKRLEMSDSIESIIEK